MLVALMFDFQLGWEDRWFQHSLSPKAEKVVEKVRPGEAREQPRSPVPVFDGRELKIAARHVFINCISLVRKGLWN